MRPFLLALASVAALAWLARDSAHAASPSSAAPAAASGAATADAPTVIVLLWDGVRHDFPARIAAPALARMARDGMRPRRLIPVFPSNSFPTQVSIATGTYPDRHGIVDNEFRDRKRGFFERENDGSWLEAEPIWSAAERQGVPAAVLFWPGSETAWRGVAASKRVAPFDAELGEDAKVDQILAWLDLPESERPRLILSWWSGADRVGHFYGPDHPDIATKLAEEDRELGRLIAGIEARGGFANLTLIVLSDHGMTIASEPVPVEDELESAGIDAEVVTGSTVAHVFLASSGEANAAEKALAGLEGVAVYRRDVLPKKLRIGYPDRVGDLVLVAAPPRTFRLPGPLGTLAAATSSLTGFRMGMHGYDPARPEMQGIFYALGRGVPRGGSDQESVRAIDVAATVSHLLGIDPPRSSEGQVVRGFAADGAEERSAP